MLRAFILFLFFFIFANAIEQNVELLAKNVKKNGDIIEATGDVLVYSQSYIISANKATYDEKTGDLELIDNVNVLRGTHSLSSNKAKLNLSSDSGDFEPFFFSNSKTKIWMQCENAEMDKDFYKAKNAIVSSCDVRQPDWKIAFDKSYYDKNTSFLHIYNATFYANEIPLMYFPYFSFSTNKERKSGFLRPDFGFSKNEGIYYKQPLYFAPFDFLDLEIDPQFRSKRGNGLYSVLRFADSPYSYGSISAGLFEEKSSYFRKEELKNKEHYGYEVNYSRDKLLTYFLNNKYDEGLWFDFIYLNDIDYLNLQDDNSKNNLDSLVTSRLNYFLSNSRNYFGAYSKYYIDTKKTSNDTTLQELPSLQYHRFLESLYFSNLFYSFDLNYHRYMREEGVGANAVEAHLPIGFYFSFFDDYLKFAASENLYSLWVSYDGKEKIKSDKFSKNFHQVSFYTDLARAYENFFHTMYFGMDYILPSWGKKGASQDFISTEIEPENLSLNLINYFYDSDGNKFLRYSIKQAFYFDDELYQNADLENKFAIYFTNDISFSNEISYSYEHHKISRVQNIIEAKKEDKYDLYLAHTFEDDEKFKKENFLSASLDWALTKNHILFSRVDYNIEHDEFKLWQLGTLYRKKCWDFSLRYKEEISPKLTSAGSDSVTRRGFYLMFSLLPLGKVKYAYTLKETSL